MGNGSSSSTAAPVAPARQGGSASDPGFKFLICGIENALAVATRDVIGDLGNNHSNDEHEFFSTRQFSHSLMGILEGIFSWPPADEHQAALSTGAEAKPRLTLHFFSVCGGAKIYPLWQHCHMDEPADGLLYIYPGGHAGTRCSKYSWFTKPEKREQEPLMTHPVKYLRYHLGEQVRDGGNPDSQVVSLLREDVKGRTSAETTEEQKDYNDRIRTMPVLLYVELSRAVLVEMALREHEEEQPSRDAAAKVQPEADQQEVLLDKLAQAEAARIATENGLQEIVASSGRAWVLMPLVLEDPGRNYKASAQIKTGIDWLVKTAETRRR
ncbi:unnamed protein product [Amoebophrya sp. A120]|nr:unnamed protein product [Amoebophrya sp. A120]|eukprot:GSA120T00012721001.1